MGVRKVAILLGLFVFLLAGCTAYWASPPAGQEVETAVPPRPTATSVETAVPPRPSATPTPSPFPLVTVPIVTLKIPTPEPWTPSPTPTPWVVTPTPYAPAEALPEGFPTVIYAVQRPGEPGGSWLAQPVQLWMLRYERGMLREELLLDLSSSAIEGKFEPPDPHIARWVSYLWVSDLSVSPDGLYIALTLQAWEGSGVITLVIQTDGSKIYRPDMPGDLGIGYLLWIPGSERFIVAGLLRSLMWGTMTLEGDYVPFPAPVTHDMAAAAVSPDGKRVIFSLLPVGEIYLGAMDIDGSNLTPFAVSRPPAGIYVRDLALSPDGRTCVLIWMLKGSIPQPGQMWVMDADGSNQRPLTEPTEMYDFDLAWSPDGKSLAFVRWENYPTWNRGYYPTTWGDMVTSLWLIDLEGKERLLLSSEGHYAHWDPGWLPDGSGLVFVSNRGGENNLWFIRADGTGLQQLTQQGGLSPEVALLGK